MLVAGTLGILGSGGGGVDFHRYSSLFERDVLMPSQWADRHRSSDDSSLSRLCQALVQDAMGVLAKGKAHVARGLVGDYALDWIVDYDGRRLGPPISFEVALELGYPRLNFTPETLSRAIVANHERWLGQRRAYHVVPRGPRKIRSLRGVAA
jgi:hypothetical protein